MQQPFELKVALVGMMASGKTTLGKKLARGLGVPFFDADEEMVAAAGMPIQEYFDRDGEPAFRKMERETIARLLGGDGAGVLSLGGGAFMQPEIRALLRGKARSVFLRVTAEEIIRRLAGTDIASRPVLAQYADWKTGVAEVLAKREPLYAEADIVFDAYGDTPAALARKLAALLRVSPLTEKKSEKNLANAE